MIYDEAGMVMPGEVVLFTRWALERSDQDLCERVRALLALSKHPYLEQTHCGGLEHFDSIEVFEAAAEAERIRKASKERKRHLIPERRKKFAAVRMDRELALIERDGYICAEAGCGITNDLTIDHIVPLSKGGTDDLDNLRFLCRSHNSTKGDK